MYKDAAASDVHCVHVSNPGCALMAQQLNITHAGFFLQSFLVQKTNWVYNKDKPSILFMYSTLSYKCIDLGILGIVANHLKSPTISAEEKDAIREHGLLINVFYEFDKSMLLFIKFVETKDYLRILSSSNSNENVEQYYDNYRICKEVRNWFEDEIDNLRMCNITKFTLMVQPKYDDDADFNKNHEIGVEVNLVMLTYPEFIVPIKGFAKTYMEISV